MAVLPETGISISLVRQTLGESSNNLGKLCVSPKLNKWSKFKPISYPKTNTDSDPDWWRTGNCGFFIQIINDPSEIDTAIFEYRPPNGGSSSPYRLGDFRGYNHLAVNPVEFNYPSLLYNNTGEGFFYMVTHNYANNLSLYDVFPNIENEKWYFGIMLSNGSNKRYRTSPTSLDENTEAIPINISSDNNLSVFRSASTIKATPFLASLPLASWGFGHSGVVSYKQLLDYTAVAIQVKTYIPPEIFSFEGNMRLFSVSTATVTVQVTNISNKQQTFRWDLVRYDKSDSLGNDFNDMFPDFYRNGSILVADDILPGQTVEATARIPASNQIVDSYFITVWFKYYDPEFGYRQMISFSASHSRP